MKQANHIKPRIYTVATAHLDTSWNWTLETTINEYIPKTMHDNFRLFEKYPDYKFSFEGSYRYELMEEYYPKDFEKVKEYVKQNRWHVTGSAYENGDVNIPSPEALFRNILFGNRYFEKTFGKKSCDIYLPDCFGFGYALPSIARHAGLMGFTTQKLVWSSAYGIPFDLGKWYGVDGNYIYASLDAMGYTAAFKTVRYNYKALIKLKENLRKYNLPFTYIFHGVGDRGGAPLEFSVKAVCRESAKNDKSKIDVLSAPADQAFRDMDELLSDSQKESLPVWNNELVSTDHGVGSYTSRAIGKRWNRRGEQLADAAERYSSAATSLFGRQYPSVKLERGWKRLIAHQFHDDITGTSLNECYKRNWNDYVLSLNELSNEYESAVSSLASQLDTSFCKGTAVIVANPNQCEGERPFCVNLTMPLPENVKHIRVFDSKGNEAPAQINKRENGTADISFVASLPSVGLKAYDIRPSDTPCEIKSDLFVSEERLENEKYVVRLNEAGDVASIFDKQAGAELLKAPIRMAEFDYTGSISWPAWEMNYKEAMQPPREFAAHPKFEIIENGCARVALKINRKTTKSYYTQIISLFKGSDRVEFYNEVDWRCTQSMLKVVFPLTAENEKARFDLGLGSIERGVSRPKLYEFPAQMWAHQEAKSGRYGTAVFSDSRTGWDKPDNKTLRLTVVHTPKGRYREESAQHLMDLGLNRFGFAVFSHEGSFENGVQQSAAEFNQPAAAFITKAHKGVLGGSFSFASVSDNSVAIRAIKKAEDGDEIVVRLNETAGYAKKNISLSLAGGIACAREINGSEEHIGTASVKDGRLIFDMGRFEVKTFAVKLNSLGEEKKPEIQHVKLPLNIKITSSNTERLRGPLKGGSFLPKEIYPKEISCKGLSFPIDPSGFALICDWETISLPEGTEKLCIIAAAKDGDTECEFSFGKKVQKVKIADMFERVGAWDLFAVGETAHIKRDTLAWNFTHTHSLTGDEAARYAYFFLYEIDVPKHTRTVKLPKGKQIFMLSALAVKGEIPCKAAHDLYDRVERRPSFGFSLSKEELDRKKPTLSEKKKAYYKFLSNYAKQRIDRAIGAKKR